MQDKGKIATPLQDKGNTQRSKHLALSPTWRLGKESLAARALKWQTWRFEPEVYVRYTHGGYQESDAHTLTHGKSSRGE
eukprot:819454-Pelagomonas_calceolata.AAC.2